MISSLYPRMEDEKREKRQYRAYSQFMENGVSWGRLFLKIHIEHDFKIRPH